MKNLYAENSEIVSQSCNFDGGACNWKSETEDDWSLRESKKTKTKCFVEAI